MPTRSNIFDESPSIDGPDYVALVIEWDEVADDLEQKLREDPASLIAEPAARSPWPRWLAIAAGAFGALVLGWRIVHRLRA